MKIHVRRGSDKIVGATIVGPHAGDLISEISVAMAGSVGLGRREGRNRLDAGARDGVKCVGRRRTRRFRRSGGGR